jgi:hypothetical protein
VPPTENVFMNLFRKLKFWFKFERRVWLSLAAGWIASVIGFTPLYGLDQGGALLICGVIIAGIFHKSRHRLFVEQILPGVTTTYSYREVEMGDGDNKHQGIEVTSNKWDTGKTIVNADDWHLYQLAEDIEFRGVGEDREWVLDRTMQRLETRIEYMIAFSAFMGTVLWAFAGKA